MITKKTILIVDDEPEILKLLEMELLYEGYTVIKASRGQEAVYKAGLFIPDMIVMDILMPDMNGGQVLHQLKTNPKTRHIVVIFLTAVLTKEDEEVRRLQVAIDEEFYPAIAKPFESKHLIREISRLMPKVEKSV